MTGSNTDWVDSWSKDSGIELLLDVGPENLVLLGVPPATAMLTEVDKGCFLTQLSSSHRFIKIARNRSIFYVNSKIAVM